MKNKKKIIKRIGAYLCALIVIFSSMGVDNYCASENPYIPPAPFDVTKYRYLVYQDLKDNSVYMWASSLGYNSYFGFGKFGASYNRLGLKGGGSKYLLASDEWIVLESQVNFPVISDGEFIIFGCNDDVYYLDNYSLTDRVYYMADPIKFDSFYVSSEVYAQELGYLQNLVTRTTWLTDSKGNADYNTTRTSVAFDLTTTTGIDLTSGDYVVRMYGQRAYFKNNFNDGFKDSYSGDILFDDDFPLVYFGEFDASSGKFVYDDDDLYSLIDVVDTEKYSGWDLFVNQIHQGCIRYYQVYNTKTGEYGGYVRVINEGKDIQTTVRDDLSVDNGGFVDKDLNHSIGSGTTYEDAELNADKYQENISDGNFSSLEGAVNSFTSTLGVVPRAIGSVFSFLPPWCHDYIGLCFGLLVALVVWKFIRG